jgi:primosomal protein N' (replication factor Y)
MDFYDVLFPVNLGFLTYRCPETCIRRINPGMIVSAPLRNRITKGVVLGRSLEQPAGALKDIREVHGDTPFLSDEMITLLNWMSEYYMTEKGLVLKNILPKEAFTKTKQKRMKTQLPKAYPLNPVPVDNGIISGLTESVRNNTYRTFLLHAPSSLYEYSFLMKILCEIRNGILLVPEVSVAHTLYPILSEQFGERICLFHSELSKGKRSESIERILSGRCDIVLGTRSAVFAPLKKVSFIAVLHEHSSSYKQESSPCYIGRDVAVMRGFLEKATVLLSSISPSIESLHNCKSGKYTILRPADEVKKPKVKVIDMRYEKTVKQYLSKTVVDAAANYIEDEKKIMFVVNRRGHSTLLQCIDCDYIEECPSCGIPLVFHKQDMSMKCHYCGYTLPEIPERCGRCKGHHIQLSGAGTQRVQEDIKELLGIKTIRMDSDRTRKKSELEDLIGATLSEGSGIIIGTKLMTRRLCEPGRFSMAAILYTDLLLNLPDFRSAEKAYQEISSIADRITSDGEIFIQTRMPQNYLYKCLKNYDHASFLREELQKRRELRYPPYARLLLMKFISSRDLRSELAQGNKADDNLEILGPYITKNRKGENEYKLLLKSSARGALHSTAKGFMEKFKALKDVKVRVDVDPVSI